MATFDADGNVASPRPAGVGGTGDDDLDLGAYDVEELLYPTFDSDGELDFDPMSSRAAWDRLGDFMGHYDDISDGESVGALDFLGLEREDSDGSESSVSDMELDDEVDGEKTRQEWEAIRYVCCILCHLPPLLTLPVSCSRQSRDHYSTRGRTKRKLPSVSSSSWKA